MVTGQITNTVLDLIYYKKRGFLFFFYIQCDLCKGIEKASGTLPANNFG